MPQWGAVSKVSSSRRFCTVFLFFGAILSLLIRFFARGRRAREDAAGLVGGVSVHTRRTTQKPTGALVVEIILRSCRAPSPPFARWAFRKNHLFLEIFKKPDFFFNFFLFLLLLYVYREPTAQTHVPNHNTHRAHQTNNRRRVSYPRRA